MCHKFEFLLGKHVMPLGMSLIPHFSSTRNCELIPDTSALHSMIRLQEAEAFISIG